MTDLKVAQAYNAWRVKVDASPMVSPALEIAFKAGFSAAEEGKAELVEAAEALRDDMLERARIAALLRKDAAVIVEAGNGVWLRFNEALARVRGEG